MFSTNKSCAAWLSHDLLPPPTTHPSQLSSISEQPKTRTLDGYIESGVILPIVAFVNGLRHSEYPALTYGFKVNLNTNGSLASIEGQAFDGDDGHDVDNEDDGISFLSKVCIELDDDTPPVLRAEVAPSIPPRYLLASYISLDLPYEYFDLDTEPYVITHRVSNDPHSPLTSDEEIFATRHGHSDSDRYVPANSMPALEQFLSTAPLAKSHGFRQCKQLSPRYDIEPLLEETLARLRAVARSTFPQFVQFLNRSQTFSLLLDEELTPSEGIAYARTFSCSIVTVDGSVRNLVEASLATWSQFFHTSENMINNEINAYNRLESA
ncbi:hypothetical protein AZE42_08256 [Rhizopogon vesiculosus]|uniref:Uncharacterized protein n=1 Tax=Rhizopogon vesiculosus TaxID=180088 RepID=A0A1J8QV10_9AGAM|nr:hypothetical protein AZE42_08256 [Rhizopogon vesiculosus]